MAKKCLNCKKVLASFNEKTGLCFSCAEKNGGTSEADETVFVCFDKDRPTLFYWEDPKFIPEGGWDKVIEVKISASSFRALRRLTEVCNAFQNEGQRDFGEGACVIFSDIPSMIAEAIKKSKT